MRERVLAMEKVTSVGQPHEMETLMTERGPVRVFVHAPASLRDLYAAAESDETFLVFGDERYSFRQSINISDFFTYRSRALPFVKFVSFRQPHSWFLIRARSRGSKPTGG